MRARKYMRFGQARSVESREQSKDELIIELKARCKSCEQRYRDLLGDYEKHERYIRKIANGLVENAEETSVVNIVELLVAKLRPLR